MRNLLVLFLLTTFFVNLNAQDSDQPPYTPAEKRLKGIEARKTLNEQSLVSAVEFESIGPTVMSGRVADLAIDPKDPTHFYVAYASAGLWETVNNGISFTPIFDNQDVLTTGDVAVNWKTNTIWLGTGENNSSRSSYSGTGLYKSTDGGKTWSHAGLPESHHIGRIVLHPSDPNTLWVAVLGHLYSPNKERGVYKTTDGGKNWKKTLFVNENAGAIDLVIHPDNPKELYAATWERQRRAWNFWEAGIGSGIHKSTDGGETWTLLSNEKSGFPTGENIGRIGLDIHVANGKTTLFAVVDNQNRRPEEEDEKDEDKLTKKELRNMSADSFLALEDYKIEAFLKSNGFPKKHDVKDVRKKIKNEEITPLTLVEYLETANSLLFDTEVVGAEVYRSDNGGKKWTKTHDDYLDDIFYSYGYYFAQIRVHPKDKERVYIMGVPVLRSLDGGKTFESINEDNVHVDHHALWLNPNKKDHLILGNDGGVNISYDNGDSWVKCNTPPLGQLYAVAVDMAKPYNVYGGLQDNGVWRGPSDYEASSGWHNSGQYPYKSIMGGDGMQIAVDTRDNELVYTGYQFGNYYRINQKTMDSKYVTPKHELGERPFRWNWQTPIHLSNHNQDILYMGSHRFHRSMNQGEDFETLSEDLTKGGKKGDVAFGTLTTISESPTRFGLIYVGSDDGLIHVSKDGGYSWERISDQLPQDMWVSRVQASAHEEGRVLVALNGYRWDDFSVYLYSSEDYGKTWTRIGQDLPMEPVNVFKEDPVHENLWYVGTDHGLYISMDKGKSFMGMNHGLPDAPVHDLVVHPRENDLIVGTHGRSIYLANVSEVQQLVDSVMESSLFVYDIPEMKHSTRWGNAWSKWSEIKDPELKIPVYSNTGGELSIDIQHDSTSIGTIKTSLKKGLNYVVYNFDLPEKEAKALETAINEDKEKKDEIEIEEADNGKYYLAKGSYELIFTFGEEKETRTLTLK